MGIFDALRIRQTTDEGRKAVLARELDVARNELEVAQESPADAQLAMEDAGWQRLSGQFWTEFTRQGLKRATELCRITAVVNPLIARGLNLRIAYTRGQGRVHRHPL